MAGRIAGITIEIDGNTTKLSQSLKGVDSQLKDTQKSLKDIDKLLKFDPKSTELLTQKQKNLEKAIGDTEKRLSELKKAQDGVSEGTDEWDALQREIIATEQDLSKLKKQYNDFGSVTAQKIAAAGEQMEKFGGKVQKVGEAFTPISTAAAGALTALGGMAYKSVTAADDLATLSKQTGISVEELQKMQYASGLVDVSVDDMTGALKKLKPKITEDNESLADLGVSVKNADGSTRDAVDVFYDTIEALSKIENETERDQKAMEIFGKGADSLAGIIDDGGAALKRYGQEAEDVGAVMSGDTVDSLSAVADTVDRFKGQGGAALAKLGATIAKVLAPSLKKVVGFVGKVTKAIDKLTPKQASTIMKILGMTAAIAPLLKVGGKLISGIGTAMKLAPKIVTAVKLVGAVMSPTTLIIAAIVAAVAALAIVIYKNWDKIKAWTQEMVAKVKAAWDNLKSSVTNIVTGIKTGVVNAWTNIKTTVTNLVTGIKDKVVGAWDNIKTKVSTTADNVKNAAVTAWNNIKSTTATVFEAVRSTVSSKMEKVKKSFQENGGGLKGIAKATMTGIKEYYTLGFDTLNSITGGKLGDIKDKVSTAFGNVKETISKTWDDIKTSTKTKFDSIWTEIKTAVDKIVQKCKDAFKFEWRLPHIKLPHFKVQGGKWPYGLGGEGYLPQISVDWYKKAYQNPVMFTQPTVLQTAQGYKGFGDNGAEIVMGLNKLRELVGTSNVTVNVYGAQGQSVDALADAVTRKIVNLQKQRNLAYA